MKKFYHTFLCAAALLLASACTIYHPQSVDIPLINHRGDARIDASASMSAWILPDVFTLNLTGSYGFSDWFAGQAHVNFGGDNYYTQLAPGAYYPLGAKSVVEGYAGLGFGGGWRDNIDSEHSDQTNNNYSFKGHYFLPFAQCNIGWHDLTKAHFDLAVGLKLGALMPDYEYFELNNGTEIAGSRMGYKTTNFLVEPQAMIRFGGEHLRFNVRMGMSWLSDMGTKGAEKFIYDYVTGSAGLTFYF